MALMIVIGTAGAHGPDGSFSSSAGLIS
jgi:hypothetical protein